VSVARVAHFRSFHFASGATTWSPDVNLYESGMKPRRSRDGTAKNILRPWATEMEFRCCFGVSHVLLGDVIAIFHGQSHRSRRGAESTRARRNANIDMFACVELRTIADLAGFGHIAKIECLVDRMLQGQENSSISVREIYRWRAVFAVVGGPDPVMDVTSPCEFIVRRSVRAGVFDNRGASLSWGAI
jgi:hypothetical protein